VLKKFEGDVQELQQLVSANSIVIDDLKKRDADLEARLQRLEAK
jgi:hypothetical protein